MERVAITPAIDFSRIVYGMWRLADDAETSPRHVQAKVESCLSQGITTMDQADIYGGYTAEGIFGAVLKAAPHLRDRVEIVTKSDIVISAGRHAGARVKHYDTSAAHITASVEASLREMHTDRIDLFLVHRPDPLMDPEETGRCLDDLVRSGKVRAVGVSNFRPWDFTLLQSRMSTPLVTNQIELSLVEPAPFINGDVAFLHERRIRPMAWSPLGGGSLFKPDRAGVLMALERIGAEQDVDASAVALAFLMRHPAGLLPVVGTNNPARIARLGEASRVVLDRQAWFQLYTLAIGREVP